MFSLSICDLSTRSHDDLAKVFLLCRESVSTDGLKAFHQQAQIVNRFVIADLMKGELVASVVRRELRRLFDVKVTDEEVATLIASEVLKRDVVDGDAANTAALLVKKASKTLERKRAKAANGA